MKHVMILFMLFWIDLVFLGQSISKSLGPELLRLGPPPGGLERVASVPRRGFEHFWDAVLARP